MPEVSAISQISKRIVAVTKSLEIIARSEVTRQIVTVALIPGPAGAGSDKNYMHDQMIASATWTVNHNLGKYPSVTIVDSSGNVVEGAVQELTANQAILVFSAAFAGKAYFN